MSHVFLDETRCGFFYEANPSIDVSASILWLNAHKIDIHQGQAVDTSDLLNKVWVVIDAEGDDFLKGT